MVTTICRLSAINRISAQSLSLAFSQMTTQPGGFTVEVIRVLIIESNPHDVEALLIALEDSSLPSVELYWDKTLECGLSRMAQLSFDIVLLDTALPEASNVAGLQRIRNTAPDVPVIILTDVDDQKIALECLKEGAQDYLIKGRPSGASIYRTMRYAIERKRLEGIKRESEDAERRLTILQQQQDLIAMLVHDLRTPIVGSKKILSSVVGGVLGEVTTPVSEVLTKVVHSNDSMLHMINNVLDSYRLESGLEHIDCREIEVSKIIEPCLDELAPIALAKGVKLVSVFESVGNIRADRFAMKRVICNLVGNAIKFTTSGGTIKVSAFDRNGVFVLQISDTGVGIAPAEMENLFKRFWQGKKKYRESGLGLGLYLCKQLVEAQHGKITCTSQLGEGTIFEIVLPYEQDSEQVLVVDDNALYQGSLLH